MIETVVSYLYQFLLATFKVRVWGIVPQQTPRVPSRLSLPVSEALSPIDVAGECCSAKQRGANALECIQVYPKYFQSA